jgi:signal transduction histidine kinase
MQPERVPWVARLVARWVSGGRGEARALQSVLALRGVFRFSLLLSITVLVPAVLLSYFALSSIRAEELYFDAEMNRRADASVTQIVHQLDTSFGRFESSTIERLQRDQPPLSNLWEMSPYLRAAFEFNTDGQLEAPFTLEALPDLAPPNAAFRRWFTAGQRSEADGRNLAAALAYAMAVRVGSDRARAGSAALARARVLARDGQIDAAERAYQDVYAEYANQRDERGFRLGDLASLQRIRLARDPEAGRLAMQELVEKLIDVDSRWVVGQPGEAIIAEEAINGLVGRSEVAWIERSRTRLADRMAQLYWAERHADELELFLGPSAAADGVFQYFERPESGTLWATVKWRDHSFAFSFDYYSLIDDVQQTIAKTAPDPDLKASLLQPRATPPPGVLRVVSLQSWLPSLSVAVAPNDPSSLVAQKNQKRQVRSVIVVLAVGMSVVGIVLSARMLASELEIARMKTDFAANVSHELRSPITQIRLKGEALQLDLVYDDADRQAHYDAIVREAERLSRLVDNVLDFAAIETGAKKYTFRPEDVLEIINNAVESARGALEVQGLQLTISVPDHLPVVWVDREALSQVLQNLLSNAAKYGADGDWIGVSAELRDDAVAIRVADRGMGIKAGEVDKIWDRFYRSADPKVRRKRGTGIGLPIVRYIVEAHGGTITVDSVVGRGTTFTFTLPLTQRDTGA